MASSKSLSKAFNIVFPFRDFLYILQQEEYDTGRYMRWLPRFFFRRNIEKREHVKFTHRARTTIVIAYVLFVLDVVGIIFWHESLFVGLLFIAVATILIPFYIFVANIIAKPFYEHFKRKIRAQAEEAFHSRGKNTKVVAITGSYGKTTVKNFLLELLKYNYKVQMVPGNINSTMGISRWITDYFLEGNDILIVEMDAFAKGRIAKSAKILPPDIAIITNIGDQHIERFGTEDNLRDALGELFVKAKPDAHLIFPESEEAWVNHIAKEQNQILHEIPTNSEKIYYRGKEILDVPLSQSNKINLRFALEVADILDIPEDYVSRIVKLLQPPERRQKVGNIFGYQGIDDSYNISYTTALAGIREAKLQAGAQGQKLLVITAGIPELGRDNLDKNEMLGRELSGLADHTFLLKSIFATDVQKGFAEEGKYSLVPDLHTAIESLRMKFSQDEWFLLQQPELTDLYY